MLFKKSSILLAMLLVSICATVAAFGKSSDAEKKQDFEGRWNVTFQLPRNQFQTAMEFTVLPDNSVEWIILAPLGSLAITPTGGKLTDLTLSLEADSQWGKLKVKATIDNDKLAGKWSPAGFIASRLVSGAVEGVRDRTSRAELSNRELFDRVWERINQEFYDPQFNGVDWQNARERYNPRIKAARTIGQTVALIRQMLAELGSSHLEFFALPAETANRAAAAALPAVEWRRLSTAAGYLRINRFEDGTENLRSIDRAFAELADAPALIIDVRRNPGGSLGIAMRIGDHLLPDKTALGYFVTRRGLDERRIRSIEQVDRTKLPIYSSYDLESFKTELNRTGALSLTTGSGAQKKYGGRIILLIDEKSRSTAEAFAGTMKELGIAALVGRRTAGAMLGADYFSIAGGWTLSVPVRDFRTPRNARIENRGVEPDIAVKAKKSGDAELERALELLAQPTKSRSAILKTVSVH